MGCSAAKNVVVESVDTSKKSSNGVASKSRNNDSGSPSKDIEIHPDEVENATVNNIQKAENGMSFEITFDEIDDKSGSLIQKYPPKRILELQASENKEPVTLDKLQEKLEEAEIRRQQILQQRIQSANLLKRVKNSEMLQSVGSENEDEQSPHHLRVPKDTSPHPSNPYDVSYT